MKLSLRKNKKAASIIEYVVLIVMFLMAILLMQKQVVRVFFGRWKDMADTFGYGEQYDPTNTIDCRRYVPIDGGYANQEIWYRAECFDCCIDTSETTCPFWSANGVTPDQCRTLNTGEYNRLHCCKTSCLHNTCNFQP